MIEKRIIIFHVIGLLFVSCGSDSGARLSKEATVSISPVKLEIVALGKRNEKSLKQLLPVFKKLTPQFNLTKSSGERVNYQTRLFVPKGHKTFKNKSFVKNYMDNKLPIFSLNSIEELSQYQGAFSLLSDRMGMIKGLDKIIKKNNTKRIFVVKNRRFPNSSKFLLALEAFSLKHKIQLIGPLKVKNPSAASFIHFFEKKGLKKSDWIVILDEKPQYEEFFVHFRHINPLKIYLRETVDFPNNILTQRQDYKNSFFIGAWTSFFNFKGQSNFDNCLFVKTYKQLHGEYPGPQMAREAQLLDLIAYSHDSVSEFNWKKRRAFHIPSFLGRVNFNNTGRAQVDFLFLKIDNNLKMVLFHDNLVQGRCRDDGKISDESLSVL